MEKKLRNQSFDEPSGLRLDTPAAASVFA
jgi:hypothetical protein